MTELYLDPDYSGTHAGTASQPFSTLDAGAWTIINAALATADVTLYASARNAASDTNQLWPVTVDITQKTAAPSFTLTFDGKSKYNTNDSTPSWLAYSGTSRCQVIAFNSENAAHVKYNKVTIDGFTIIQPGGSKGVAIAGDDWFLQNCDISHSNTASDGPLVLLVPTCDAAHEGSNSYTPACARITIQNNIIHDSFGESIYLGGAGCSITDSALSGTNCTGFPAHDTINILNNTIYNSGIWGGEGDGIDVKAAITNVTIRGNTIYNLSHFGRAIVMQGIQTDGTDQHMVIERNRIHDVATADSAIYLANTWGTVNGVTIRNNLVYTITGSGGNGILVYDSQASPGVLIYNNTIYNCGGYGITAAGTQTTRNNTFLANNGGGAQADLRGTNTTDHNAYSNTFGAACTTCVSGLTTAAFANAAAGDFTLPAGSALIGQGTTIASFANDFAGLGRAAPWDIGAYAVVLPTGHLLIRLSVM